MLFRFVSQHGTSRAQAGAVLTGYRLTSLHCDDGNCRVHHGVKSYEIDRGGSGNEQIRRRSTWTCAMRKRDAGGEAMKFL